MSIRHMSGAKDGKNLTGDINLLISANKWLLKDGHE